MIKSHILTCPACNKTLRKHTNNNYSIEKTCSNKHHIIVWTFNDWHELVHISLRAKNLNGNMFVWNFINKTLYVHSIDGKSKPHKLPWLEPDFYLYEKLIKKLNIYVLFL